MFTHFTLSTKLCLATLLMAASLGCVSFFITVPIASAQVSSSSTSVAALQAMLQQLMAQIAQLTQGGSTPGAQPPVIGGSLAIGTVVKTSATVRVRATGSVTGGLVGTQAIGQAGSITAGPVAASGYSWYRVDFVTGADGWVAGNWITASRAAVVDVNTFVRTSLGENNEMESGLEDASIANITLTAAQVDRYANKVVLLFRPATDNSESLPWVTFEDIALWSNGYKVLEVNASDVSAWTRTPAGYEIAVFKGNQKIPAGRAYALTVSVTTDDDVAAGDRWSVSVPSKGVIIWSQLNGHMTNLFAMTTYPIIITTTDGESEPTGSGVVVDPIEARSNAEGENGEIGDFTVEFSVTAADQDVYIKTSAAQSPKDSGVSYVVEGTHPGNVAAAMSSLADEDGGYYVVSEGETEDFEVNVWVRPTVTGQYRVSLEQVNYSETLGGAVKTHSFSPAADFRTPYINIMGSGISPVEPPVTATAKITATPAVVAAIKNGQQVVTLSWLSTGTSRCSVFEDRKGAASIVLIADQKSAGTFKVTPTWKDGLTTTAKQYRVRCQDASTLKDSVVEATTLVKLGTITDPIVKPTPRFNGLTYPVGTAVASVSAVFAAPLEKSVVTGPVIIGKISWGDAASTTETVSALATTEQITVTRSHTYKKAGTYTITLIGLDGKTVSEKVTVTLPVVAVTPNKNNFGCGRTLTTKFENGKIGCYGIWDYGDAFGGDVRMCGAYGVGKTGCIIKTPVCSSGSAKATAYYTGATIPAAKLTTISSNLKTSASIVTKEIAGLWEYTCIAAVVTPPVSPVPTTAPTTTVSGSVLGVTTNIYEEISQTLSSIAGALSAQITE